jgi:hypothetical protein
MLRNEFLRQTNEILNVSKDEKMDFHVQRL